MSDFPIDKQFTLDLFAAGLRMFDRNPDASIIRISVVNQKYNDNYYYEGSISYTALNGINPLEEIILTRSFMKLAEECMEIFWYGEVVEPDEDSITIYKDKMILHTAAVDLLERLPTKEGQEGMRAYERGPTSIQLTRISNDGVPQLMPDILLETF